MPVSMESGWVGGGMGIGWVAAPPPGPGGRGGRRVQANKKNPKSSQPTCFASLSAIRGPWSQSKANATI
jgi:hypothetical protein